LQLGCAHGAHEKQFAFVHRDERRKHVHDDDDDAYEDRHKHDGFATRSAPYDDEGTERDFRKRVKHDDIRLEHLPEQFTPPEQKRDGISEHDGDEKAEQGFRQRDADMVEERAFCVQRSDRIEDARRRADEEGVRPTDARDQLPQGKQKNENANAQRPDQNAVISLFREVCKVFCREIRFVFHPFNSFHSNSNQAEN